ncbi:recombinase family protein [Novosphingobium sp. 2637]|uniref:Recombinase family protein n=2 Tax=Novosphingobium mangrovi (ex Hu et al. 2023) TaxID=2930094 RepID=A0ABT0AG72_9SPHN|nr:recombinase family protein [Novosphingobium mangrovi (ex Hu et al. 2023)]
MEQTKGSTLARQLDATATHISEMGWEIYRPPLIDRGKSAYTGDNIETGQLGKFAKSIMTGTVDATSLVLVVEELDRLSRQPADVMLSWLSPLVRRGLSIKVVSTGQMISVEMLDHDMGGLMMILITAFGSHTESRKKAGRVAAAWEKKREAARDGQATIQRNHRHPKWIEIATDGSFFVPEDKARIVRMIFENRIAGIGKGLTAKKLNELSQSDPAYAPWPLNAGERKAPKMWTPTYVGRILANRAVLGEWQPYHRPRKGAATPAGDPISDFYPQVIDPATFARANEKRLVDALKHQGRGRGLSNLLGTRAACGSCGGRMDALGSARPFINKKGEQRRHYFLYCRAAKVAKTCDNERGWPYDKVEGPLLDRILTLAMDDQHFAGDIDISPLEAAVHNARATVMETERRIGILIDTLETVPSDAVRERLSMRQNELAIAKETVAKAQEELAAARGKVSPAEHIRRVSEVRANMWAEDADERFEARRKIKEALSDVIDVIKFDPETGKVRVSLRNGVAVFSITADGEIVHDFDLLKDNDNFEYISDPEKRATLMAYKSRRKRTKTAKAFSS